MNHGNLNDWYFGWGWLVWFGFIVLMFSIAGNWGYTYRAHQKYGAIGGKDAINILNERYARGELTREQFMALKSDISKP